VACDRQSATEVEDGAADVVDHVGNQSIQALINPVRTRWRASGAGQQRRGLGHLKVLRTQSIDGTP
jgi:hypothetical protein